MSARRPRVELDHGTHEGRQWSLYHWAEQMVADAGLPPFTPDEAAQVGVIAARLDARDSGALDGHLAGSGAGTDTSTYALDAPSVAEVSST